MDLERKSQIATIIVEEFMNVFQYISKEVLQDGSFELLKQIIEENNKEKMEKVFAAFYLASNNIINRVKELSDLDFKTITIQ